MLNWCDKLEVVDILAFIFIVFAFVLKLCGIDGTADMVITALIGFYFGHKIGTKAQKNAST